MRRVYSAPFRVYLILAAFALLGIYAGFNLPISLYPNSTRPLVGAGVSYGSLTPEEFKKQFGNTIESRFDSISDEGVEVDSVTTTYYPANVRYKIQFSWGTDPKKALNSARNVMNSASATLPSEIRNQYWVNSWSRNSGFLAVSFFSKVRSLNELYDLMDPVFGPKLSKVEDAENPVIWNPSRKEISIEFIPEALAAYGLFPRTVESAIKNSLSGFRGGEITQNSKKLTIKMSRQAGSIDELKKVNVQTPGGDLVPLARLAHIDLVNTTSHNTMFKTNGTKSLILFSRPKSGGNVKKMADDILDITHKALKSLPKDIEYRVLVNPSDFIRSSVKNVMHEVFLAAGLAVLVLFLFVGSFKNTITAAIEIPLSMIMAFILMKMTDMNINLISLGGLALSAGMNVDASVVVMENIFRHFEKITGPTTFKQRLEIVIAAVKEVFLPVLASTVASLVVFLPLAFTSALTNAILGDLAKAVVFSHGFSAFVALILVPTIRLHIMSRQKSGSQFDGKSPIEGLIVKLENGYGRLLQVLFGSKLFKGLLIGGTSLVFIVFMWTILPNLKKEIIGMPDTDWIILGANTNGNSLVGQMETTLSDVEQNLLNKFGDRIKYTFMQIHSPNSGNIMARLKDKREMDDLWKQFEKEFVNTPTLFYWVSPWNPAQLPIPDPPHMKIFVRGGNIRERALLTRSLREKLNEKKVFPRLWSEPSDQLSESIVIKPDYEKWPELQKRGIRFAPYDLIDLARVATVGKRVGEMSIGPKTYDLKLRFPQHFFGSKSDLESHPVKVSEKYIPLRALADIQIEEDLPQIYREDGKDVFVLYGKENKGKEGNKKENLAKAKTVVAEFLKNDLGELELKEQYSVFFEDSEVELNDALKQLAVAVTLSICLIFFTLIFQFGSLAHSIIILTAIPTGIMGVLFSLFIFKSTISLNSVLGVILLNGIAVANSIILVDFIRKLVADGLSPRDAAIVAGKKRLRPILITSLTTILGMLPIALGLGEGGKILRPLGLSVAGGLWFSMIFTLFIVPFLEVLYLEWKQGRDNRARAEKEVEENVPMVNADGNREGFTSEELRQ